MLYFYLTPAIIALAFTIPISFTSVIFVRKRSRMDHLPTAQTVKEILWPMLSFYLKELATNFRI